MAKFGIAVGVLGLVAGIGLAVSMCAGGSGAPMGGMMGGGMMGGGMMGGSDLRHGGWHHVQMHGLPRDTSSMPFEKRGRYIFDAACSDCHGQDGRGGVHNPNYENDTVPALDELADSMGIFRQAHADAVIEMLRSGDDPAAQKDNPPFRGYPRFLAQFETVRDTIVNGRDTTKKDPSGPAPQDMPAWGRTLDARDVDAVIAHIIQLHDFPEPAVATPDASSSGGDSSFP